MPEVSGQEFFESTVSRVEPGTRTYRVSDGENRYIELTLHAIERDNLFDELNDLPQGFIDLMMQGSEDGADPEDLENEDEIDIDARGSEVLAHLDGDTINVFESLFARSATHEELTSIDMEELAEHLDFETLFDVGGEIIDLSLSESGEIKRFREPDSGKSS